MNAALASKPRQVADPIEVEISDLAHDGRGVVRGQGKVMFVADALPGERVRVQWRRGNRLYDEAQLLEILQPSPQRVPPRCAHFGVCGGCASQHCAGEAQLHYKQTHLLDNLRRIGQVEPEAWLPPLAGPLWAYRRRARLGVKYVTKKGRVLVGFRERGTPYLAELQRCEVLHPAVGARLAGLAELLDGLSLREQIPQIEVAIADNAVALVLRVLAPLPVSDRERLLQYAREQGLWFYLQSGGMDSIQPLAADTPELYYDLSQHGVRIYFEPGDFVQINAAVNAALVDQALSLLDTKPTDRVLELFSGLGNFSLPLARQIAQLTAVEGSAALVQRAQRNAERNGIGNVEFHAADLFAAEHGLWSRQAYDKLLLDPPRAGAQEILPLLMAQPPARIVYISCHPATLARDAAFLVQHGGYRFRSAGVVDMFPHTHHVESIALFEHV
ncbi:MAG: 23S rRNA (uracil(1939)-C(5))-methyltransferase RlmD [Nevskiales bacterium]